MKNKIRLQEEKQAAADTSEYQPSEHYLKIMKAVEDLRKIFI